MLPPLRLAVPADIAPLQALIDLSVRQLSAGYYSARQIASGLKYVFGVDTQLLADGTYYVVESNGALVGCGGWSRRQTLYGGDQHKPAADPLLDPARGDQARIRAFFVHPAYARRGIGRALLAVCEDAARAAGFRGLELAATLPGEPLYRALGYAAGPPAGVRLPDGEHLTIVPMSKIFA